MDWLETAKKLPQGRTIKTSCDDCQKKDKCQLVSHGNKGYSRHCFRCGEHEFVPYGDRTLAEILRHRRERDQELRDVAVELPKDFTLDIPDKNALWLYKAGISAELARSYGIGYSEYYDRVVLPVYDGEDLVAMQMRATDGRNPKYINPKGPKTHAALFKAGIPDNSPVIVEDILSAIKVGRVKYAVSVLGTSLTDLRASRIAKESTSVTIWMDSDDAGRSGARKAQKQMNLLGIPNRIISTEKDPKLHTLNEIRRIIHD